LGGGGGESGEGEKKKSMTCGARIW
jgi:hypothetical protein